MGCVVAATLDKTTYLVHQVSPTCQALCVLNCSTILSSSHPATQPDGQMKRWPIIYHHQQQHHCHHRHHHRRHSSSSSSVISHHHHPLDCYRAMGLVSWEGRGSHSSGDQDIRAFLPELPYFLEPLRKQMHSLGSNMERQ